MHRREAPVTFPCISQIFAEISSLFPCFAFEKFLSPFKICVSDKNSRFLREFAVYCKIMRSTGTGIRILRVLPVKITARSGTFYFFTVVGTFIYSGADVSESRFFSYAAAFFAPPVITFLASAGIVISTDRKTFFCRVRHIFTWF